MMTKNQGQALAAFVHEMRNDWDAPGILAQLAKCQHLNAWEVAHALLRLAATPEAKTPGALMTTSGPHWRERTRVETPMPPRRQEQCLDCGRHLDGCLCGGQVTRRERGDATAGASLVRAVMNGGV